jgi:tetratricopeptide (TPR) repeat protein
VNPVVQLCGQGMQAEADGREADARDLFLQAGETATDDYEACVAAHCVARRQPTPAETLHWNQECLDRVDRVGDDRVKAFYASLHLNMARAHADLYQPEAAREHYRQAAAHLPDVPPGQYADWTRYAIANGLRSTDALPRRSAQGLLTDLMSALCARGDLKALALILPAHLGDLGTEDDRLRLTTALHMVHAGRWLPDAEQHVLRQAISALAADETP